MCGADGQNNVPHRVWLQVFEKVMNEVKDEMMQQGRGGEFLGARVRIFLFRFLAGLTGNTDYIFSGAIHYARGTGLVSRRLYRPEKGVPTFDSGRVSRLLIVSRGLISGFRVRSRRT